MGSTGAVRDRENKRKRQSTCLCEDYFSNHTLQPGRFRARNDLAVSRNWYQPALAETLCDQGDLAEARKLQEEALDILRRVLGPEHPYTTTSAWNLFLTLQNLDELAAAAAVLERDLLWLLDRDPATLGSDQRTISQFVAQANRENG